MKARQKWQHKAAHSVAARSRALQRRIARGHGGAFVKHRSRVRCRKRSHPDVQSEAGLSTASIPVTPRTSRGMAPIACTGARSGSAQPSIVSSAARSKVHEGSREERDERD